LLLTYSGSIVSIGTMTDNERWAEYASIELRADVPNIIKKEGSAVASDIKIGQVVEFKNGPIKKSSHIYKIAVCDEKVSIENQEKRIKEATIFLTNGFIQINRTIINQDEDFPEQFNMKAMVNFIAQKNNMKKKAAKQVLQDFLYLVEAGILLKSKVSMGRLGKLYAKKRDVQKARVGINPSTGEKITIKAKPKMYVPKMAFSRHIKKKTATVSIE
ncbi:HU family DNA-binding protein, partial [Spirochaetota bacterium]